MLKGYITQHSEHEAHGQLREVYDRILKARGKLSNIMRVHSLQPQSMEAHLNFYLSLMFTKSGLSREEREMIAVVVSGENNCAYCVKHHTEALLHYWKDSRRVEDLVDDWRSIELSERQQCITEYAIKLTRSPSEIGEGDIQDLRDCGLSDEEILLVNQVAAYFNYVNRSALGLGVQFSADEVSGYRY